MGVGVSKAGVIRSLHKKSCGGRKLNPSKKKPLPPPLLLGAQLVVFRAGTARFPLFFLSPNPPPPSLHSTIFSKSSVISNPPPPLLSPNALLRKKNQLVVWESPNRWPSKPALMLGFISLWPVHGGNPHPPPPSPYPSPLSLQFKTLQERALRPRERKKIQTHLKSLSLLPLRFSSLPPHFPSPIPLPSPLTAFTLVKTRYSAPETRLPPPLHEQKTIQ